MQLEYGGWSKTTGKKREAISSGESFEQANLSDMNRVMQRAKTKSTFRSDLRTASPTPSLWSSSDISDGGAVPVQVVVNKSGAELAVERQKAHGSMIMATIAMKKQAFEAAKEMHQLFPEDVSWHEASAAGRSARVHGRLQEGLARGAACRLGQRVKTGFATTGAA
jgi:hypothetical protein